MLLYHSLSITFNRKTLSNKLWHDDEWVEQYVAKVEEFDYLKSIRSLQVFGETHPQVMQSVIERKNWQFNYDISFNKTSLKDKLKLFAKNYLGLKFGYKNYKIC